MSFAVIRHKVQDVDAWKSYLHRNKEMLRNAGVKSFQVLSAETDKNDIMLVMQFVNMESAKNYLNSSESEEAMREAGVLEEPFLHFMNFVEEGKIQ